MNIQATTYGLADMRPSATHSQVRGAEPLASAPNGDAAIEAHEKVEAAQAAREPNVLSDTENTVLDALFNREHGITATGYGRKETPAPVIGQFLDVRG